MTEVPQFEAGHRRNADKVLCGTVSPSKIVITHHTATHMHAHKHMQKAQFALPSRASPIG